MNYSDLYILHLGAAILGVYTNPSLLVEAQADWNSSFLVRFGRLPEEHELPKVSHVVVNRRLGEKNSSFVVGEEQVVFNGEAN